MMRRKFTFLILLILILGLVGCKGVHLGGHSYGQWQTVQEATCLEDGLQERVCSCGAKDTQVLPALGHTVVVDEAKTASCTESGLTEGSHCSVCNTVLQEQQVIAPQHVTEETPVIEPDCTRAGKEAGAYCILCGEYVISPQKIRQNGHNYVNGVCTVCNAVQPDMAAAIMINDLEGEPGVPNFCTKQAYPAGSTITFDAYVPTDSTWWAVSWTQNPANASLYKWTDGAGVNMDVETGKWQTCTVTLPSNGGSYYIYIVGAKGEWGNKPLMIDNVTITNAGGTVLGTDSFKEDVAGGLFDVVKVNPDSHRLAVFLHEACPGHWYITDAATEPNCEEVGLTKGYHCGNCGRILKEQEEIPALGHQWDGETCSVCGKLRQDMVAALRIDNFNESVPMNFITKEAYAGGSTVKFQAYVPFGVTWWTVNWTTDPAQGDLYVGFSGQGQDMNGYTQMGKWAEYTVKLPDDGKQYYIYFVGAKGEWNSRELLINNLTVTDKAGTLLASEDFDSGVKACIFDVTELNSDNQKVAVFSKVLEDPCKDGHTVVIHPSVEPTCSKPGLTEGQQCSVCGQVLVEQQELPALGHTYGPDGVCECGAVKQNRSAAIHVDRMDAAGRMNFITRDAYAGGSILSFRAFIPNEATWWTVNWTTDPAKGDLYVGFSGQGQDMNGYTKKGQWTNYTVTLPDDGKQYYIYFAGAKGEWNGQELLIDDVVLTDKHGKTVLYDSFDDGIHNSVFTLAENNESGELVVREVSVVDCLHTNKTKDADVLPTCVDDGYLSKAVCADCGVTLNEKIPLKATGHQWENGECTVCHEKEEQEPPAGNYAAALYIDNLTESAPMSFITKQAYPGGSTVKFRAFVPNEATWWTVNWTTDPAKGDLYVGFSGQGQDMNGVTQKGQWAEYTVHLPNDGKQYYIYFVGAKGEWKGKPLLIDDVVITPRGGTAVTENFNSTVEQSMFDIVEAAVQWEYLGELEEEELPAGNYAAALYIDNLTESAPMSFITKQAYPGGSTVKFRAFVPNEATWWTVNWTTDPAKGDLYVGFSGQGQDMNGVTQKGQWAEYTVHLPNDGKQYYIYFVGAKGEWKGKPLLIDDVVITPRGGTAVTEDFNSAVAQSMFDIVEAAVQWKLLEE